MLPKMDARLLRCLKTKFNVLKKCKKNVRGGSSQWRAGTGGLNIPASASNQHHLERVGGVGRWVSLGGVGRTVGGRRGKRAAPPREFQSDSERVGEQDTRRKIHP
jgi:hypothetical protein